MDLRRSEELRRAAVPATGCGPNGFETLSPREQQHHMNQIFVVDRQERDGETNIFVVMCGLGFDDVGVGVFKGNKSQSGGTD